MCKDRLWMPSPFPDADLPIDRYYGGAFVSSQLSSFLLALVMKGF